MAQPIDISSLTPADLADLERQLPRSLNAPPEMPPPAPAMPSGPGAPIDLGALKPDEIAELQKRGTPSLAGDLTRQFVSGATFGLEDEIFAGGRAALGGGNYDDLVKEERARKEAFEKNNFWKSLAAKTGGAVVGSFLPASWLARFGAGGRAVAAALPVVPSSRIAGATIPRAMHEAGKIGAKGALWQSFGDAEGTVGERAAKVLDSAPSTAATGYVFGAPFGYLGRAGAQIADDLENVARSGIGADAAATRSLRETMQVQNRSVADVARELMPDGPRTITDEGRLAVLNSYSRAQEAGMSPAQIRQQVSRAYAATARNPNGTPLAPSTVDRHVNTMLTGLSDTFNSPLPMLTAERLSGVQRPIQGALEGETRLLMNAPGAARTVVDSAVNPRQMQMTDRMRDLVTQELGPPDFTNYLRQLQNSSRAAKDQAYGVARANARPFDIEPVIARHAERARAMAGTPHDELVTQGQGILDWWNRIPKPSASPTAEELAAFGGLPAWQAHQREVTANLLNSYRQARAALTERIEALRTTGTERGRSPEAARALVAMKRDLDAVVARSNRDWWRANRGAADDFAIERAADRGRNLPMQEGASLQEAKDWFRNASQPERQAFERGMARQLHDKVSRLRNTQDAGNTFLVGDELADEGMRGLLNTVMGPDRARRFLSQVERERTALATYNMGRGSHTSKLEQLARKRDRTSGLFEVLRMGVNPLGGLERLTEVMAGRNAEARDAAMARRLFATDPRSFLETLRLLQAQERPRSELLQGAIQRVPEAVPAVMPSYVYDPKKERR